jgi:peptide deformylase
MVKKSDFDIVELGDPRLRRIAQPVAMDALPDALETAHVMQEWMDERGGVGIAAPQIGVDLQMMIIASRPNVRYPDAPDMAPLLMINPEPLQYSDQLATLWEGCLSVPGIRGKVARADSVEVRFIDKSGRTCELALSGFPARIFLHEYDHLIGKTFVDRVASVQDLVTDKVYFEQFAGA